MVFNDLISRNGKIRSNRDIVLHRQRSLIYGMIDLNHSIDSIISFDHQVVQNRPRLGLKP